MREQDPETGTAINLPIGVLVMAYGGPNSLDEIPGYLADIRGGRPTTPAVLEEITHNYRAIGGRSPLLELTHQQIQALSAHFDPAKFKFYLGMRHWAPWIEDTIREMLDDGITNAISIVMAPHYSKLSIAKYQSKIAASLEMFRGHIEFAHVESYHDSPGLIRAFANCVLDGLTRWSEDERPDVHVVFSAHSLPERILKLGDPYDQQLRETARLVAAEAGLKDHQWSWSYQSAGRSPEPWLGPQLQEHLPQLAQRGIRNVISLPIGFVSDHVELLYDIDIQAQGVARELGMRLERPPALNADPLFIKAVADEIREHLEQQGWLQRDN
jgi:protoporphyrin/coproporphyrin ferrochelatase